MSWAQSGPTKGLARLTTEHAETNDHRQMLAPRMSGALSAATQPARNLSSLCSVPVMHSSVFVRTVLPFYFPLPSLHHPVSFRTVLTFCFPFPVPLPQAPHALHFLQGPQCLMEVRGLGVVSDAPACTTRKYPCVRADLHRPVLFGSSSFTYNPVRLY